LVTPPTGPPAPRPPYAVGETLGLDLPAPAIVVFVKSTCPYCTASAAFYRALAAELVPLVVVSAEPEGVTRAYLRKLQVEADEVRVVTGAMVRFRVTPSIVTLDREGKVTGSWQGQLPPEQEQDVLKAVKVVR